MKNTNEYKITITARNYDLQSENLKKHERYLLQKLLDGDKIENLNISLSSMRRKSFGFAFVDFNSTNEFTISENIENYYSATQTSDLNLNSLIEQELNSLNSYN